MRTVHTSERTYFMFIVHSPVSPTRGGIAEVLNMFKVSAVHPPRRSAVLTVFRGATAINDGTTAEPRRSWWFPGAVYAVQAPQWHSAPGVALSESAFSSARVLPYRFRLVGILPSRETIVCAVFLNWVKNTNNNRKNKKYIGAYIKNI